MNTFELFPANVELFRAVHAHHSQAVDWFFLHIGRYAGSGYVLIPIVLLLAFIRLRTAGSATFTAIFSYRPLLVLLAATVIECALVQSMKAIFNQPRPYPLHVIPDALILVKYTSGSFPSGDVAQAFMMACALWQPSRGWLRGVLGVYAVFVGYERMYIGVHFPLDVAAGALVGVLSVLLATNFVGRISGRSSPDAPPQPPGKDVKSSP